MNIMYTAPPNSAENSGQLFYNTFDFICHIVNQSLPMTLSYNKLECIYTLYTIYWRIVRLFFILCVLQLAESLSNRLGVLQNAWFYNMLTTYTGNPIFSTKHITEYGN